MGYGKSHMLPVHSGDVEVCLPWGRNNYVEEEGSGGD